MAKVSMKVDNGADGHSYEAMQAIHTRLSRTKRRLKLKRVVRMLNPSYAEQQSVRSLH